MPKVPSLVNNTVRERPFHRPPFVVVFGHGRSVSGSITATGARDADSVITPPLPRLRINNRVGTTVTNIPPINRTSTGEGHSEFGRTTRIVFAWYIFLSTLKSPTRELQFDRRKNRLVLLKKKIDSMTRSHFQTSSRSNYFKNCKTSRYREKNNLSARLQPMLSCDKYLVYAVWLSL